GEPCSSGCGKAAAATGRRATASGPRAPSAAPGRTSASAYRPSTHPPRSRASSLPCTRRRGGGLPSGATRCP
ncbi:MAG: hypothetical protein M1832_001457, partial [Thelocarpon impressellum]